MKPSYIAATLLLASAYAQQLPLTPSTNPNYTGVDPASPYIGAGVIPFPGSEWSVWYSLTPGGDNKFNGVLIRIKFDPPDQGGLTCCETLTYVSNWTGRDVKVRSAGALNIIYPPELYLSVGQSMHLDAYHQLPLAAIAYSACDMASGTCYQTGAGDFNPDGRMHAIACQEATVSIYGTTASGAASFVKMDTTTQGNWKGVYGADGYNVINSAAAYPSYVTVSPSYAASYTWAATTADPRGLQGIWSGARIAACWYSPSAFNIALAFNDSSTHQVALYVSDWDGWNGPRAERIDILDNSGNVLDSRSINSFGSGMYLVWNLRGHVIVRVNNTNPSSNALINGIFFR